MTGSRWKPAGLSMAFASLAMMVWGLSTPGLWLDESASIVATQRTWGNLFRLLHGADAPLVPYYTLLKVLTGLSGLIPGAAAHPELLYRWPSVLAMVAACTLLIGWMSRFCPPLLVFSTAVVLLLIGGLSRYAQEVRPYALVLLLGIVATIAWTRLIHDQQPAEARRTGPLIRYAIAVAIMVVLHDLAIGLIAAHLVAALSTSAAGERRAALRRTSIGAGLGLLIASPQVIMAALNGSGASAFASLTPIHLASVFVRLFTPTGRPLLGVGPVLLLAVIGLATSLRGEDQFIARLAASWAIVPPLVLLPALLVRPNLLIGRYVLYTLPGWAILAGLGVSALAGPAQRLLSRAPERTSSPVPRLAGLAVVAVLLTGSALAQAGTLAQVRTPGGHNEDIRPALLAANRGANARLGIVVSSSFGAIEVPAYDQADDARLIGLDAQHTLPTIWPTSAPYHLRKLILSRQSRVVLFLRTVSGRCEPVNGLLSKSRIMTCMPAVLRQLHYHVVAIDPGGQSWAVSVLARTPPARLEGTPVGTLEPDRRRG